MVLLHGLATPGEMFQPIWDSLAARHELLIPDLRGTGQSAHLPGPYTVEQLAADVARLLEEQMLAAYRAMAAFDSRSWLDRIRQPTLIVSGAQDRAVPGRHARELAQGIRGAEIHELPNAGHALIYTHVQAFLDLLEAWLAEPGNLTGHPAPSPGP